MFALWRKLSSEVSSSFLAALLLCAGFWGFVAWDQSHWWRVKPDYSFGWLVPAFVMFAIHDRWSRIVGAAAACAAEGSPRVAGWQKWVVRVLVGAALMGWGTDGTWDAAYRAADVALYASKQSGKNVVTMAAMLGVPDQT